MRKFNFSFTDGQENEFIPMLCQQDSMADIPDYRKNADTLECNIEFDYLPNNLIHRLMVERYCELDMKMVWRTGARFEFRELGYSAVLVIDGSTLQFFIRHTDSMHRPNTYLTMLKAHVDQIVAKMNLKAPICKLIYKLDRKRDEFDFEELKMLQGVGQHQALSKAWLRMIPIVDILNQSALDGLEDERKLLEAIIRSCRNIQGERSYCGSDEDQRNQRIRDDLHVLGYAVQDQTQRGLSGSGRGVGELDLLLLNDQKEPWAIIEALQVSGVWKAEWNKHLDKLMGNYNCYGAPCVYLLTYVDGEASDFQRIWKEYLSHVPTYAPESFTYCKNSLTVQNKTDDPQYVKTAVCRYDCDGRSTTAYHIFARIPTQENPSAHTDWFQSVEKTTLRLTRNSFL